jgi:hypothetical protein
MVEAVAATISRFRPDLPPLRARAMARTTVATFTALQDGVIGSQDDAYAAALVVEWRRIVKGYLVGLAP